MATFMQVTKIESINGFDVAILWNLFCQALVNLLCNIKGHFEFIFRSDR